MSDDIPFLDLKSINSKVVIDSDIEEIIANGRYLFGNHLSEFERNFSRLAGTKHCVGVGSGLDALIIILESLKLLGKLKDGDRVAVPANTFVATFLAVVRAGLVVVPIDVNERSFNIDLENLEELSDIKAVIAVHLYGQICDVERLSAFCLDKGIVLIEDAAQAHGATWQGKPAGSWGIAAGFSFYPGKNLGCIGDGGAITTNNDEISHLARKIRNYGSEIRYEHEYLGMNSRLDEINSAFLVKKMVFIDQIISARRDIAAKYRKGIKNLTIMLPDIIREEGHVWHLFVVRVRNRQDFMGHLKKYNIDSLIHYPIPAYRQTCFRGQYEDVVCPVTDQLAKEIVSLPIYETMSNEMVSRVISACNEYKA